MDIKVTVEKMAVRQDWFKILIVPKDAKRIVSVLRDVLKRSKPDKFEQIIVGDLVDALVEAEKEAEQAKMSVPQTVEIIAEKEVTEDEVITQQANGPELLDKAKIVNQLKAQLDPNNGKTLQAFMKESIDFGVKQFHIKDRPKENDVNAFYDWLLLNGIVYPDGRPNPNKK